MTMQDGRRVSRDQEQRALQALAEQEKTSRQETLPEDSRLTEAREVAADLQGSETFALVAIGDVMAGLLAYAEERLRVNRGLLAQAKAPEPTTNAQTDLAEATDGELLQVCFDRGLITVSAT